MLPPQFKVIDPFCKMQQVAILREPLFGNYRYFAGRQRKFLYMVKNMVFQLNKRDFVRPEIYNGINIKPVIIFFNLKVNFTVAENITFFIAMVRLFYFKTL